MKNSKKYLDKIVDILEKPYNKELGLYGVHYIRDKEYILSKIYGEGVKIIPLTNLTTFEVLINNLSVYIEHENGRWFGTKYNSKGLEIYSMDSTGYWIEYEYDENDRVISKKYVDGEIFYFSYPVGKTFELKIDRWYEEQ